MVWIIELVCFLLFVCLGGFPGFLAWCGFSLIVYIANRHFLLKSAELELKAATLESDKKNTDET